MCVISCGCPLVPPFSSAPLRPFTSMATHVPGSVASRPIDLVNPEHLEPPTRLLAQPTRLECSLPSVPLDHHADRESRLKVKLGERRREKPPGHALVRRRGREKEERRARVGGDVGLGDEACRGPGEEDGRERVEPGESDLLRELWEGRSRSTMSVYQSRGKRHHPRVVKCSISSSDVATGVSGGRMSTSMHV